MNEMLNGFYFNLKDFLKIIFLHFGYFLNLRLLPTKCFAVFDPKQASLPKCKSAGKAEGLKGSKKFHSAAAIGHSGSPAGRKLLLTNTSLAAAATDSDKKGFFFRFGVIP